MVDALDCLGDRSRSLTSSHVANSPGERQSGDLAVIDAAIHLAPQVPSGYTSHSPEKSMKTLFPLLLLAAALTASAQNEKPLTSFPYTPGVDVTAMDKTADPCADFYKYTCGGWMKNNPIPADQARWSVYGKLYQDNQQFLWGILDQLSKQTGGRNANQQKIGDYFGACMDEASVNLLGAKPLQPYLDQIAALQSAKDLPALLAGLHTSL
jgi:putative endopeptidase